MFGSTIYASHAAGTRAIGDYIDGFFNLSRSPAERVHWQRYELKQGGAPNARTTARVALNGRSNRLVPSLLTGAGFRYGTEVEVEARGADGDGAPDRKVRGRWTLRCAEDARREAYECSAPDAAYHIVFRDRCREGTLAIGDREAMISPWRSGTTFVGYTVSFEGRARAGIDIDHQWTRPVWIDPALDVEASVGVDLLAYVANDMFDAQLSGGSPFLCKELVSELRYPR